MECGRTSSDRYDWGSAAGAELVVLVGQFRTVWFCRLDAGQDVFSVYGGWGYEKQYNSINFSTVCPKFKRKNKDNAFLQHKLLNKIVGSVVRLDKIINAEGNTDPLQSEEAKKKYQFDLKDNEDDFYQTLEKLLSKISDEMKENIKTMEKNMIEEEKKKHQKKKKLMSPRMDNSKKRKESIYANKNILTIDGIKKEKES